MSYAVHNEKEVRILRDKANQIWKELSKEKRVFEGPLKTITGSTRALIIKNENDFDKVICKADSHARNLCSQLSPTLIPLLVQMVELFYYGHWKGEPKWVGTVAKRIIAYIYNNQFYSNSDLLSSSRVDLIKSMYAVALHETLVNIELIKGLTNVKIKIERTWFKPLDDTTEYYLEELMLMYGDRGESHRTLKDSARVWIERPKKLLETIDNILEGQQPSDQPIFKDNFFRYLPVNKAFWEHLQSLVQLMIPLAIQLDTHKLPLNSVVFLPGNKILNQEKVLDKLLQVKSNIYWKKNWYHETVSKPTTLTFPNMLVYRPILNYSKDGNLNVTSMGLIADAINYFIESSIFKYEGHGTPFHSSYQKIIAEPFEKEVRRIFRSLGFLTGDVPKPRKENSHTCFWNVLHDGKEIQIEIINRTGAVFPGEIDVLAYHPLKKVLVLVECKTFQIPYTFKEMESLKNRFTKQSKDSYQKKLLNKSKWLEESEIKSNGNIFPINLVYNQDVKFSQMIVVDRKLININKEDRIPIHHLRDLTNELRNLEKQTISI